MNRTFGESKKKKKKSARIQRPLAPRWEGSLQRKRAAGALAFSPGLVRPSSWVHEFPVFPGSSL